MIWDTVGVLIKASTISFYQRGNPAIEAVSVARILVTCVLRILTNSFTIQRVDINVSMLCFCTPLTPLL